MIDRIPSGAFEVPDELRHRAQRAVCAYAAEADDVEDRAALATELIFMLGIHPSQADEEDPTLGPFRPWNDTERSRLDVERSRKKLP